MGGFLNLRLTFLAALSQADKNTFRNENRKDSVWGVWITGKRTKFYVVSIGNMVPWLAKARRLGRKSASGSNIANLNGSLNTQYLNIWTRETRQLALIPGLRSRNLEVYRANRRLFAQVAG